jgi:probable F420-dependent oxidoreductase
MKLGVGLPVSGGWATPDNMRRIAVRSEELGYDSLWSFQRLLHPVDQDWGPAYHAVQDPITSLAYVAGFTSRIRLGIAVLNIPFYSPIVLAKPLTTLDIVSGGRLDVGLGLGWSEQEFQAVGTTSAARGARAEEFVACLDAIWTDPEVEFHGTHYTVPLSRVDPKPVQRPRPPVLMGASAEVALRRIGRIADGWISSSRTDLATIGESIELVKRAATEAGRDARSLRFVVRGVVHLVDDPPTDRTPLRGTADQIRGDLERLAAQGVTEVFFDLNWDAATVSESAEPVAAADAADAVITALAP